MIARVNGAGFSGAQVQQQGSNNIVITVPGASDRRRWSTWSARPRSCSSARYCCRRRHRDGDLDVRDPDATPSTAPTPAPRQHARRCSPSPSASASSTSSPHAAGAPGSAGQAGGRGLASGSRLLARGQAQAEHVGHPHGDSSTSPPRRRRHRRHRPGDQPGVRGPSLVNAAVLKLFNKLNCNDPNWRKRIGYITAHLRQPGPQIVSCASTRAGIGVRASSTCSTRPRCAGTDVTSAQAGMPNSQTVDQRRLAGQLSLQRPGTTAFGTLTAHDVQQVRPTATTNPNRDARRARGRARRPGRLGARRSPGRDPRRQRPDHRHLHPGARPRSWPTS